MEDKVRPGKYRGITQGSTAAGKTFCNILKDIMATMMEKED